MLSNFPKDISPSYHLQDQEIYQKTISLFRDRDHDKMSDEWENTVGLEVGRDDSQEDPDKDAGSNIEEFYAQSNPFDTGCDCTTQPAFLFIAFPFILYRRGRKTL